MKPPPPPSPPWRSPHPLNEARLRKPWDLLAEALLPFATDPERLHDARAILARDEAAPSTVGPREVPAEVREARETVGAYENGLLLLEVALHLFKTTGRLPLWGDELPTVEPPATILRLSMHEGRVAALAEILNDEERQREERVLERLREYDRKLKAGEDSGPLSGTWENELVSPLRRPNDLADLLGRRLPEFAHKGGKKYEDDKANEWKALKPSLQKVHLEDGRPVYVPTEGKTAEAEKAAVEAMAERIQTWWREKQSDWLREVEEYERAQRRLGLL